MSVIVNPYFKPTLEHKLALEANLKAQMEKNGETLGRLDRMRLSEMIAEDAVKALFKPIEGRYIDANTIKNNQPGYDFLVDNSIRVQVKGNTFVECVQWLHKGKDPNLACLRYDVIIVVDIGVVLKNDFGKLAKHNIETKEFVDFYVIPIDKMLEYLQECRENKIGKIIYWYKRALDVNRKEYKLQFFDLPKYRNNFDALNMLL